MLCLVGNQIEENKRSHFLILLFLVPDHEELNALDASRAY